MTAYLIECQVRWVDMDAYRHVNNTVFLRYCEQARIEMFGFEGSPIAADWEPGPDAEPGDGVVLASLDMDYRRPLHYRDGRIHVQTWVTRLGTSSVDVAHRVVALGDTGPDAKPYATAATVMVAFNKERGHSRPLRAHERERLESFTDPALPLPRGSSTGRGS